MSDKYELLKGQRSQVRRLFTTSVSRVKENFDEKDRKELELEYKKLEDRAASLFELDEKVREIIFIVEGISEIEITEEYDKVTQYRDTWIAIQDEVENRLWPKPVVQIKEEEGSINSKASSTNNRRLKYPKLKLREYSGELKEWIGFWAQYKRIHEDEELSLEDKFQYLRQCMKEGSEAQRFLERFPPSAENYEVAFDRLKRKFGRDDLLKEVYVRELLKLVSQKGGKLCDLFDSLEANLKALESLGVTMKDYNFILYPLTESALPEEIWRVWERKRFSEEVQGEDEQPLEKLLEFLRHEVECEDRLLRARSSLLKESKSENHEKQRIRQAPTAATLIATDNTSCIFCDKISHKSQECYNASDLSLRERKERMSRNRCCFICLKTGHLAKYCNAKVKCMICRKKHMTVVCPETENAKYKTSKEKGDERRVSESSQEETQTGTFLSKNKIACNTLLQTLLVKVVGRNKELVVRALLDSGSQRSYITKECVERLGLQKVKEERLSHSVFGGLETKSQIHGLYLVKMKSLKGNYSLDVPALDQMKICNSLPKLENKRCIELLKEKGICLSDAGVEEGKINLLVGADIMGSIMTGRIENIRDGLIAVKTKLGWTVMGKMEISHDNSSFVLLNSSANIEELWKLETLGISDPAETKSQKLEEDEALDHFNKTVCIGNDGRYEVELPWILGHRPLESNRVLAERRLFSVTNRLKNIGKFEEYNEVFKKWKDDDIIEIVPDDMKGHYLPHHAVIKESSRTTKVRPVFDASARDTQGNSLNASLFKGTNFVELIPAIMLRFREHEIGVSSDIEKAFLQIIVKEKDRDFLRFLWWEEGRLQVLRHKRVVFGVKCSPFLLGAVLRHFLEKSPSEFGGVVNKLKNSMYVDNCITSVRGEQELKQFMKDSRELMASAGFNLRDWHYTDDENGEEIAILGMLWEKRRDTLRCAGFNEYVELPLTRRKLLSVAQRVFDPVGHSSPATVIPKLLLQESWKQKIGWDVELPQNIQKRFKKWYKEVDYIWKSEIPRRMKPSECKLKDCSLHVFSDASKVAFGGCVFLRAVKGEEVEIQLLMAKVRIAPLKQISVPRLELLGALIAARLYQTVKNALNMHNLPVYLWTDSSVTLAWIKKDENWNPFVANRIKEIRDISKIDDWYHIPGSCNPADVLSRGCAPKQLFESEWWNGPSWLKNASNKWPHSHEVAADEEVNAERKKMAVSAVVNCEDSFSERLSYFSSYTKLVRMVGWMLRFKVQAKGKRSVLNKGELSVEEFQEAEKRILIIVQQESLEEKKMRFSNNLHKIKGADGLWRIKTRFVEKGTGEFERPIILPARHHIVEKLIMMEHKLKKHAGLQILMAALRERFWIIKARKTIRRVIAQCGICRRFNAKAVEVPVAPLPRERTECSAPFETTGVDLAGPLYLKNNKKCWIVLFTCAVYRAVHFEVVLTLSTDEFMAALRRFIARRGRVVTIFSDNGTNFKGTENALQSVDWDKVNDYCVPRKIQWKFNPPTAAWWGGWWERLVRSIKELLRRNLGQAVVNQEELYTLLCECEAVINSRPLTYVYSDAEELKPLTPATFLHELPNSDNSDLNQISVKSLQKRERYLQTLRDTLKRRFRTEYLALLTCKGKRRPTELQEGDVVLVEKENAKRLYWPLAVIQETITGKDGVARVARLKTAHGEMIRPYQRLYLLEAHRDERIDEDVVNETIQPAVMTQNKDVRNEQETKQPAVKTQNKDVRNGQETKQTTMKTQKKENGPGTRTRTRVINIPDRLNL